MDVKPLGLVGLPRVAAALRAAGLTVIGNGDEFRDAVPPIREARTQFGFFPVLVADTNAAGIDVWLNMQVQSGTTVVVAAKSGAPTTLISPNYKRIDLPTRLSDVVAALGYDVDGIPQSLREATVDADGAVAWDGASIESGGPFVPPVDPNAPDPVAPVAQTPAPSVEYRAEPATTEPSNPFEKPVVATEEVVEAPSAPKTAPTPPTKVLPPVAIDTPAEPNPFDQPVVTAQPSPAPQPTPPAPAPVAPPQPTTNGPAHPVRPPTSGPGAQYSPVPQRPEMERPQVAHPPATHQSTPAHVAPEPQYERPDTDSLFSTQPSRRAQKCPVIVVWAGKGGVGKTTYAAALGQRAGMNDKRVIVVDANYGQAGQSITIGLPPDRRSIYDSAIQSGRLKAGLLSPAEIKVLRDRSGRQPIDVKYALLAAPPPDHADLSVVTPSLYLALVEQAREVADLVVVDTQIVEADTADPMVSGFLIPLLRDPDTWQLSLSDESREGIANLFEILSRFHAMGIRNSSRVLSIFNRVPRAAQFNEVAVEKTLSQYGTYIGSAGMDVTIQRAMNAVQPVADQPTLAPLLDAVLHRVLGDDSFNSHFAHRQSAPAPQRRRFRWPWGRR